MADYRHRAILVTGYYEGQVDSPAYRRSKLVEAHTKAKSEKMFGWMVSDIVAGYANGFATFEIVPSGLKRGTQDGEQALQKVFVRWLGKQIERNQCEIDWAWVQYGDEVDDDCRILDASDRVNIKLAEEEELMGDSLCQGCESGGLCDKKGCQKFDI